MPESTDTLPEPVRQFFKRTPLLARLCEQNGWLDEESLDVQFIKREEDESLFEVRFEEILKEGSGCECGRNVCWGQVALRLSDQGKVIEARIVAGTR